MAPSCVSSDPPSGRNVRVCGAHVKPGQSGNPGGRPKGWAEVNALARQHTAAAIEALVKSLSDRRSEALERLSCDELEQLCTLYERMGIGLEGAERSAGAEANVVPLKAPPAAEGVAGDLGEPSAAPASIPAPAWSNSASQGLLYERAHAAGAARYRKGPHGTGRRLLSGPAARRAMSASGDDIRHAISRLWRPGKRDGVPARTQPFQRETTRAFPSCGPMGRFGQSTQRSARLASYVSLIG